MDVVKFNWLPDAFEFYMESANVWDCGLAKELFDHCYIGFTGVSRRFILNILLSPYSIDIFISFGSLSIVFDLLIYLFPSVLYPLYVGLFGGSIGPLVFLEILTKNAQHFGQQSLVKLVKKVFSFLRLC